MLRAALVCIAVSSALAASARGWNSWYNFFGASNETSTLAAAEYIAANLLEYGYDTLTIDEGWSDANGASIVDGNGLLTWNVALYPSGIPALAGKLRAMGLKLGLWLARGVPRIAALQKLPIAGTPYTCADAVRMDRNCSWSSLNFGSNAPHPAAKAYYRALATKIDSWGVSLVKIDCMWPNKYEGTPQVYFNEDVEAETAAFRAATPGMSISLSPGISVSPSNGTWLAKHGYADIYRIAEDVLDVYNSSPDGGFPQGVHQKLTKALEYEQLLGDSGTWPDFDMLQVGSVIHSYDSDALPPSETRLTRDEQVTAMTLWCVTGTPLIIGGRLPLEDNADGAWTLSLLTNAEVLAMHNESAWTSSFVPAESPAAEVYGWAAGTGLAVSFATGRYAALFNANTTSQSVTIRFTDLNYPADTKSVCVRDMWTRTYTQPVGGPLPGGDYGFVSTVNAHGARAFLVTELDDPACSTGAGQVR